MAGLYIHIPFCEQKCLYCDFYSLPRSATTAEDREFFLLSLKKEIVLRSQTIKPDDYLDTVFFGGGTPSLLTANDIDTILNTFSKHYNISSDAEITLEANPGTLSKQQMQELRAAGINRLSIGVQSFRDDELRFLSRIHTAAEAKTSILNAQQYFENISIDLIYALPQQTLQQWIATLESAIHFSLQHLSCYTLIVEPKTQLFEMVRNGVVQPLDNDTEAEFFLYTSDFLSSFGYQHYEISNFCKPTYECKHNLGYWTHQPYLGFGPSAHSFYNNTRWWNTRHLFHYCSLLNENKMPISGGEHLNVKELKEETILLGLRSRGINLQEYYKSYNEDFIHSHKEYIETLITNQLAIIESSTFRLTPKGYAICDEICQRFLNTY